MKTDWRDHVSCTPDQDPTPPERALAQSFIEDNCSICPVTAECLENSTKQDLFWSVRGGMFPLRFGVIKSAPLRGADSITADDIKASLEAPRKRSKRSNMLDRGVCPKGHKILSELDIHNRGCRKCGVIRNSTNRKKSTRKRATDTHCCNGHEKTPENGISREYTSQGSTRSMWVCNICQSGKGSLRVKGSLKSHNK